MEGEEIFYLGLDLFAQAEREDDLWGMIIAIAAGHYALRTMSWELGG
jgi:hypothetical protein